MFAMLPSISLLLIYAPIMTVEQPKNLNQEVKLLEKKDSWMLIGRGLFGSVFSFQDGLTGVKYAVKIIQTSQTEKKERFRKRVSSEPITYKGKETVL